MKVVTLIARLLLGAVFVFFGLNHLFNFLPTGHMPAGLAGQFLGALMASKYFYLVGICEAVPGILLLLNRYLPLGLVLLAPVIVNIDFVDATMARQALPMAALITILWILVAYRHRAAFSGLLQPRMAA